MNEQLAAAADAHAKDMYSRNYFDHISPDQTSPVQRAPKAGFTGKYVGENIAKGYNTTSAVMLPWRKSESHCKLLMGTLYANGRLLLQWLLGSGVWPITNNRFKG
ncbi:hypothetical protein C3K47_18395 [Solitalea longa]|uniref:SCP domain-containing protein n=1 Tax=Solitalea longa TaxID=2079460 RepID=A0A2S4ZXN3_9SPHI|nr:CAP domain-containing protein [Solitalea longa]POY34809.1 hypothetical protein C3K47_18395 [Solitalea longa]